MIIKEISFLTALWGGFSSFFSIWQLCLMQITPFFLAFAVGFYALQDDGTIKRPFIGLVSAGAGYILAFSIVFALMGTHGFQVSGYILYNIDDFRTAAATAIGMIASLLLISGILDKGRFLGFLYLPIGLILGASFAISYSPCIPPVMSDIMNFGSKPSNAAKGILLLTAYGFGLTSAFVITGMGISVVIGRLAGGKSSKRIVIAISSAILFIMVSLLATGLMAGYKSFLVGLVLN